MTMMTMMRQFTIRLRMLGAIAMVLALLSMLGLGGLWGMGQIKDQSDDFLHHSFAEVQHLSHLRGALAMVRMAEKDMIIEYERPNEVEKAYTRWKQNLAETEKVANGFLEGEEDPDNVVVRELILRLQSYAKLFEPITVQLKSSGYESATTANRMSQKALAEFLVARATGTRVHERGFDGRLFEGPNGEPLDFSLHQSMDHTSGNAYTRSASTTGVGNAPLLNWLWEEALKEWA